MNHPSSHDRRRGLDHVESEACTLGRRRFIQGVGAAAGASALVGLPAGRASALPAGASQFVALPKAERVLDTRNPSEYVFTRHSPGHVSVPLTGRFGIPNDASAVVATVTAVNLSGGNWVAVVPLGVSVSQLVAENKLVSTLNMLFFGEATANLAQVKLANGGVDIHSLNPCEMILDVLGYYRPVAEAVREGRFIGLPKAERAIDTRRSFGYLGSGQTLTVEVTDWVPADASAVVINLTATECTGPGYFTAYSSALGAAPDTSNLNVNFGGATRAVAAIVPISTVGGRRSINVFALTAAKIVVDVTGFFTGPSSLLSTRGLFVPVDPVRILDTREPGQIGRLWPEWVVEGTVPGPGASEGAAIVVNLTGVDSRGPGYFTIAAARRIRPDTSNVNWSSAGAVVPNHAISPITYTHGYQVYSSHGAHVLVDYAGYYTGDAQIPAVAKPTNPPPPSIGPTWTLHVPRLGLVSEVRAGDPIRVTDSGHSWHWTGTGYMGQEAHVAMFAHRTEHGGAYRYLHHLDGGDQLIVTTADRREFTYSVVRRDLTDSRTQNILEATRFHPGTTLSLIACSRTDFSPTSLSWRIVVTAELIGWREF